MKKFIIGFMLVILVIMIENVYAVENQFYEYDLMESSESSVTSLDQNIIFLKNVSLDTLNEYYNQQNENQDLLLLYYNTNNTANLHESAVKSNYIYAMSRFYKNGTLYQKTVLGSTLNNVIKAKINEVFVDSAVNYSQQLSKNLNLITETTDFESAYANYTDIIIGENNRGYLVLNYLVFRYTNNGKYLFRIENSVQFTSGRAAIESNYDDNWLSNYATVNVKFNKSVQYGYGVWYSAMPNALDYWPKNNAQYKTITSGYDVSFTWGRTESAGVSTGDNGFGLNVNSAFTFNTTYAYHYQEQWVQTYPSQNSQWLSQSEGAAWEYTGFNHDNDIAVNVYPGILVESKRATPVMPTNGKATIEVRFEVVKKGSWYWPFDEYKTIAHTTTFDLLIPNGSL